MLPGFVAGAVERSRPGIFQVTLLCKPTDGLGFVFLMVWFCSVYVSENASQCQRGEQEGFVAAGRALFLCLPGAACTGTEMGSVGWEPGALFAALSWTCTLTLG